MDATQDGDILSRLDRAFCHFPQLQMLRAGVPYEMPRLAGSWKARHDNRRNIDVRQELFTS